MKNSRLILLIETLNSKEIREIRRFLNSPFFNKKLEITRLFEEIIARLGKSEVNLTKEVVYAKLNSDSDTYHDQEMRIWMSLLLKQIEKYLVHSSFFGDPVKSNIKLAEIYRLRNLPKPMARHFRLLEQMQEKKQLRNAEYYQDEFQIQLEQNRTASADARMTALNLQQMSNHLDYAYFSKKLRQSCLALSHQSVYNTEYQFGMLNEILTYVEQNDLLRIPAVSIYYYGYQLLSKGDDPEYFQAYKKILTECKNQFEQDELGDLYILGINYCIKKYNAGERAYLSEEFDLYKDGLNFGVLIKNNVISRYTYRNVVTLGLVLKEYEWVENFIHTYQDLLDQKSREGAFSLSLAQLEYSRKNYDHALQLLQKSNYKEVLLNLAAKTVMLKIFYELEEFDILSAHLSAMKIFIRRKKMIAYHRENYVNLIRFTQKLISYNFYDKKERKLLLNEVTETKMVAEKDWLIGRIS